jgi:chromosome segregation ATPase
MSVFKNIKSLFIVEEEGAGPAKSTATSKSAQKAPAGSTPKGPVVEESSLGDKGKVTEKFMDVLFSAMEKNNLDGFDYLEYKQSLQSLVKMPMDEATRYQSAFAMAQTMGANPQKLIQSADHYISVLQKEEKKFEAALANQTHNQIASKEKLVKELDATIKQKEAQIQKLQKEIAATRKKQEALRADVKKASVKVQTTKNNFIASYNQLVSQIQADMDKMKQYLK